MYSFCTHIRHSEGFFEGARTLLCSYCDTQTHTHTDTETKYPRQIYDKCSFLIKVEYSGKMELVATKILLIKLQKKVGIRILTTNRSS